MRSSGFAWLRQARDLPSGAKASGPHPSSVPRNRGTRLLHALERVGCQGALGLGPVEGALDADDGVPLAALPARVRVQPAGDVQGLQFAIGQQAVHVAEGMQEVAVPAAGVGLVVLLGPVKEQVQHLADLDVVGSGQVGRVGGLQPVEGLEDLRRGVPAGLSTENGRSCDSCPLPRSAFFDFS
jgi:hypothetical protein